MTDRLAAALAGRYSIERELGGGGMSRVFVAREAGLDREVVIKVLPDDVAAGVSLDRFSREIQLAASLQQANIVPLLAAGDAAGVPYYAMPYVQGESLRGRLSQPPRLTVAECTGILRDVARALSYAHARGVVHRDIKPDNVLLSHGAAVVTDFGIAKAVSASRTVGGGDTLTQAGTSLGTPAYMSPEQVAGDPGVDHRADLYAWGCMAYELLAGEPPFVRESAARVLAAHLADAPVPLAERRPEVPAPLARVVMQCLAKDPAGRPSSADELLRALEAVFTPAEAPAGRVAAGARPAGRGRRGGPAIALALLVVALVAAALWRGRRDSARATTAAIDRSIAVLPLTNLSGDRADDYFGIGLAEEMTRALSKSGVRVIGRTSAGALLAKGLDERAVARELGVGSLLTGSVQRAAGQIRINVSLLSAADGAVQWTEKYDRPIANVFAVQDEIARAVATRLGAALGTAAIAERGETSDPEAYALFLQAKVLLNRRSAASLRQASTILEQVGRRDPGFARAQALLALTHAVTPNYIYQRSSDAVYDSALAVAARALARDSSLADAWAAIGWVRGARGQMAEADRALARALACDSTNVTALGWHALHLGWRGDSAASFRLLAKALALEPASLIVRTWQAQGYLYAHAFALADSVARFALGMDATFDLAAMARAEALVELGRAGEAVAFFEPRVAPMAAAPASEYRAVLAYALVRAGQPARARALLEQMRAASGGKYPALGSVAVVLNELGDGEQALAVLADAIAGHDPWTPGFVHAARYTGLRKDPRGAALLATVLDR